ncbi:MAG: ester cyclase [Verrucomicrobiota bacterium]
MATLQESNKARMREFVQVVQNEQDVGAIDRFISPDFVNPDVRKIVATGVRTEDHDYVDDREGDKVIHRMLFAAFPDIKITILDMAADGDKVWTYKRFEGTHSGPWMDIPATGRQVSFHVVDIMSFRDGLIIDHTEVSEFVNLLNSLRR